MDICRRICDIPHGPLCDNCNIAVFFPRTRERNSKKIFLATDDWCNYRRRPGGWINHPVLTCPFAPTHTFVTQWRPPCHCAPPLVIASAAKQSSQLTCRNATHIAFTRSPRSHCSLAMTKMFTFIVFIMYNSGMKNYEFYVYIMFNHRNGTLYTGVTNDIRRRVYEHKNKIYKNSFTAKYNCDKLAYYETFQYINDAIEREKKIKSGSRAQKVRIIESINPSWLDLSEQDMFWFK